MYYRSDYPSYNNCYHFTASTKYRKCVFSPAIREKLGHHIKQKADSLGLKVHALAVAVNHVHILIQGELEPKKIAQFVFGFTSRMIRKEFPELDELHEKQLWGGKACTNIKDESHFKNAVVYIDRHDPEDSRAE